MSSCCPNWKMQVSPRSDGKTTKPSTDMYVLICVSMHVVLCVYTHTHTHVFCVGVTGSTVRTTHRKLFFCLSTSSIGSFKCCSLTSGISSFWAMHFRIFSSIPVLYPPDVRAPSMQMWRSRMSPDILLLLRTTAQNVLPHHHAWIGKKFPQRYLSEMFWNNWRSTSLHVFIKTYGFMVCYLVCFY